MVIDKKILLKTCSRCNEEKDFDCFSKNRSRCKKCIKEYRKIYREKNKEKIKKYRKIYYENNKELASKYQKHYREDNKEKIRKKKKDYDKLYNCKNRDKISKRGKRYRENNKNKVNKYRRQYYLKEVKDNLLYRLRNIISKYIYNGLKRNDSSKNGNSCGGFISYTMKELKTYIDSQFEDWMSWDNWGVYDAKTWDDNDSTTWTWQIDHIIPHSSFNYSSMEDDEFKKCWALDNLRPYSAKQNIIDGNRR